MSAYFLRATRSLGAQVRLSPPVLLPAASAPSSRELLLPRAACESATRPQLTGLLRTEEILAILLLQVATDWPSCKSSTKTKDSAPGASLSHRIATSQGQPVTKTRGNTSSSCGKTTSSSDQRQGHAVVQHLQAISSKDTSKYHIFEQPATGRFRLHIVKRRRTLRQLEIGDCPIGLVW